VKVQAYLPRPNNGCSFNDRVTFVTAILCEIQKRQRKHCHQADSAVYRLVAGVKITNRLYDLHPFTGLSTHFRVHSYLLLRIKVLTADIKKGKTLSSWIR